VPRYSDTTLAAIKNAVDIVNLVNDYGRPIHRSGNKLKALCPFHDDHNPSLELSPDRQTYKCWSCGAGGDVFTFVQEMDRVDFPEAIRVLAERAGITLEQTADDPERSGPSKTDLFKLHAWVESQFVEALHQSVEAKGYVERRGLTREMVDRFRLGYAPSTRDWLATRARRVGFTVEMLEIAGLVIRSPENDQILRERFHGRLLFPIHDVRGRTVGFGGRILPELEQKAADAGRGIAKYLNSPETILFKKSRNLYGVDLARPAARTAGWVGVVEGYTDVIAAHQVGLTNVVGTLGTALTDDHVKALRALADRVVLVFDGDEAGQKAADRSLELFLGHEVDVRVLTLPEELDPCDFLLTQGAEPFQAMVDQAVDPLTFAIDRAATLHDLDSPEGSRLASERVLAVLARVPSRSGAGLDVKVAKALDTLARRIRVPVVGLTRRLAELRGQARRQAVSASTRTDSAAEKPAPIAISTLDPVDCKLIRILLNDPAVADQLITRVTVASLRDAPLRAILQASFDILSDGRAPTFELLVARLDDPAVRDLASELLATRDLPPLKPELDVVENVVRERIPQAVKFAQSIDVHFEANQIAFEKRDWQERFRDLRTALGELNQSESPDEYRLLRLELEKLNKQRPDTKRLPAS
jgi:DNA primase